MLAKHKCCVDQARYRTFIVLKQVETPVTILCLMDAYLANLSGTGKS